MAESQGAVGEGSEGSDLEQIVRYAEDLKRTRTSQRALLSRLAPPPQPRRRKILIVDDEQYLRALLVATLDAERYEITEASRGLQGLMQARAELPALIILDVRMPDLDGIEVCRRLRADPLLQKTPIVMLTAAVYEADRRAGMEAGASRYITKPFSPLELLGVVEDLLGQ